MDGVVAFVAATLSTPYPELRREPITRLLRMYEWAVKIDRARRTPR